MNAQTEAEKIAVTERNNIRDNQTKILLDKAVDNSLDSEKLTQDLKKHQDKMALDEKKLNETIRSNKAKESISKIKKTTK